MLPSVAKLTHTRAQNSAAAAESEIVAIIAEQATLTGSLWEALSEELSLQEAMWVSAAAEGHATHACTLLSEAFASHDASQVLEALAHGESFGFVVATSLRDLIRRLLHEEDLEVMWRCLAAAVSAADRVELEFWVEEAASHGLSVPRDVQTMLTALCDEERAKLVELEHQASFDAKVKMAHETCDHSGLQQLVKEAKLRSLDASLAEAALAAAEHDKAAAEPGLGKACSSQAQQQPPQPQKPERQESKQQLPPEQKEQAPQQRQKEEKQPSPQRPREQPQQPAREREPLGPTVEELKRQLAELGVSSDGVFEKTELLKLLSAARNRKRREANETNSTAQPGPRIPESGTTADAGTRFGKSPSRSTSKGTSSSPPGFWGTGSQEQSSYRRTATGAPPPASGSKPSSTAGGSNQGGSSGSQGAKGKRGGKAAAGDAERTKALACLGLDANASPEEIRKAYKQAAMKWHPDRRQNHAQPEEAKQRFQEIRAAYDTLQAAA